MSSSTASPVFWLQSFAGVAAPEHPLADLVADVIDGLRDSMNSGFDPAAHRSALRRHLDAHGERLRAALDSAGYVALAQGLGAHADALRSVAHGYASAHHAGSDEALAELYERVVKQTGGLMAWLEEADGKLAAGTSCAAPVAALTPTCAPQPVPGVPACPTNGATSSSAGAPPVAVTPSEAAPQTAAAVDRPTVDWTTWTIEYRGARRKFRPSKGFEILSYLAEHPDHRRSHADIERAVWRNDAAEPHTIEVHVSKLRELLRSSLEDRALWADLADRIKCWRGCWFIDRSAGNDEV